MLNTFCYQHELKCIVGLLPSSLLKDKTFDVFGELEGAFVQVGLEDVPASGVVV